MNEASLETLIQKCIELKKGNKEFALFYTDPDWRAEIGNPTNCVMLGEVEGDYCGEGISPVIAVGNLLQKLEESR